MSAELSCFFFFFFFCFRGHGNSDNRGPKNRKSITGGFPRRKRLGKNECEHRTERDALRMILSRYGFFVSIFCFARTGGRAVSLSVQQYTSHGSRSKFALFRAENSVQPDYGKREKTEPNKKCSEVNSFNARRAERREEKSYYKGPIAR